MADKPTNRQTVLLVDDESAITDALAPYLERSGFSVAVAHDGAEGLDVHDEINPDIVVTDVMMPRLDGRQLVREIRARGGWTPIILLTQIDQSYERSPPTPPRLRPARAPGGGRGRLSFQALRPAGAGLSHPRRPAADGGGPQALLGG